MKEAVRAKPAQGRSGEARLPSGTPAEARRESGVLLALRAGATPYRGEALTKKKGVVRAASTLHFCDKFRTCAQKYS